MSPIVARPGVNTPRFPRVSGDEPEGAGKVFAPAVFSPRERG